MANTKDEFSAGGVVFKKAEKDTKIVLIARNESTIWCLPKGKIESGESPQEAARREVKEETGLDSRLVKELGSIKYQFFTKDHTKVFKVVLFFLFSYLGGSTKDHDHEVDEARWFTIDEALEVMTYPSEREIVTKSRQILQSQPAA